MTKRIGRAYAFFGCNATKQKIAREMPRIRELAQVPPLVEVSVFEGQDKLKIRGDKKLKEQVEAAANLRYAMEVMFPGRNNKAAATEASCILNQAYQSPLFKEGEPFRGWIVYKQNEKYVNLE